MAPLKSIDWLSNRWLYCHSANWDTDVNLREKKTFEIESKIYSIWFHVTNMIFSCAKQNSSSVGMNFGNAFTDHNVRCIHFQGLHVISQCERHVAQSEETVYKTRNLKFSDQCFLPEQFLMTVPPPPPPPPTEQFQILKSKSAMKFISFFDDLDSPLPQTHTQTFTYL